MKRGHFLHQWAEIPKYLATVGNDAGWGKINRLGDAAKGVNPLVKIF